MHKQLFYFVLLSGFLFTTSCCLHRKSEVTKTIEVEDNSIYNIVESMPVYPGGEEELMKFLAKNIVYPTVAKEIGVSGSVYASFVVEKNGSISNVEILKGIGSGCDEEVIRVVKLMPNWTPGVDKGKKVRVKYNIPVKFKLE